MWMKHQNCSRHNSSIVKERHGEGIGYFMLSITVGAAIGPFFGMFLIQHGGYAYIFLDIGTGVGPFFLGFLVSPLGYRGMYLAMAGMTILFMIFFLPISKNQEYKDIKMELE